VKSAEPIKPMTHPKITFPARAANIFWVSLRAPLLLLTLPFLLVTYLIKLLAEWADHLEDFISDLVRSITATFSPKIFNALNEALKENKRLEEHNKFLQTQYRYWEKRAKEIDEADFAKLDESMPEREVLTAVAMDRK